MLNIIILIGGFFPLIFGANYLVDYASSLAKKLNIPNIVIGLTIVAFGTSAPELIVNLFASLNHNSALVLGNVVGSNLFNVMMILGLSAVIYPLAIKSNTTWIEVPLCFLSAALLFVVANDSIIDGLGQSIVSRTDGIILLFFFIIFIVYNIRAMLRGEISDEIEVKDASISKSLVFILLGILLLVIGGKAIEYSAVEVARLLNISDRIIALTIVSVGTSLPELATSIVAAKKRNTDIAIGNIVGSNIFNVFLILGVSSTVYPVMVSQESNLDMLLNIFISLLLFIFIFTGKGRRIDRWEGGLFVALYVIYVFLILVIKG
ncbi:MAG: calcium/sodium antiporter [Ignavibacteriales bacterium]|nr:calcium/sodium antiporter [Ignavibacteriales bacterium]